MSCYCVVFDMDGVLFDSEALVMDCWEMIAQQYRISNIRSICRKCLGTNANVSRQLFLDNYGAAFPYDIYKKEVSSLYHQAVAEGKLRLKPGVQEILCALRAEHIPVGLASSTRQAVIRRQLELFGLESYFDVMIGGDQVQKSKPDPEIYLTACHALHMDPEKAYAVEDSYNGIRAAFGAGMRPVMIPDLLEPNAEMERLAAHIFPDLYHFLEYLFIA